MSKIQIERYKQKSLKINSLINQKRSFLEKPEKLKKKITKNCPGT
jgi:hypothetical protein